MYKSSTIVAQLLGLSDRLGFGKITAEENADKRYRHFTARDKGALLGLGGEICKKHTKRGFCGIIDLSHARRSLMVATALRQEVISYVDMLDEAQTQNVLIYVRNLAKPRNIYSDSRSPAERADAIKAFEELEKMDFHVKGETSLDGRKERTEALWRKYESLS